MSRLEPSHRSDYSLFRSLQTRWEDMDIYGHVNNVVYLSYFDTAINGWYLDVGLLRLEKPEAVFLVAETGAQYFKEINFPDRVDAGIRVTRLGSSSVSYDIALFTNEDDQACARGRYTHVLVDHETRRPVAIDPRGREQLSALLTKDPS